MLDLDNTLVDRAAAFAGWAHSYVSVHGGDQEDVAAVITFDGDGLTARDTTAALIADRLRLAAGAATELVEVMRSGLVEEMTLEPAVAGALRAAREAGWRLAIVTNGSAAQQERKIRHLELDGLVDAWVVSESAGVRKPDPRIFRMAARMADSDLIGAWMVGDSAEADIAGAVAVGVSSAWIRRQRTWATSEFQPTLTEGTASQAIHRIIRDPGVDW